MDVKYVKAQYKIPHTSTVEAKIKLFTISKPTGTESAENRIKK